MNKSKVVIMIIVMLCFVSVQSYADIIPGLYNTGVTDSGVLLSLGADSHYSLGGSPAVVANPIPGPGIWLANGPISQWISPTVDQTWNPPTIGGDPAGDYIYIHVSFDLTGLDPDTAVITGQWATDDIGSAIFLNATDMGFTAAGYSSWSSFSITDGFLPGSNSLNFVVHNDVYQNLDNPTGLRVEMSGTASPIPEPTTMLLLGFGFFGLAGISRKLKK